MKRCTNIHCRREAVRGEKYCTDCRKALVKQMKEDGYLRQAPAINTVMVFSDQRGRKARSSNMLGGTAELGDDGDD